MRSRSQCSASGIVFDIQGYSVDDGPGIRKLIFLKGCHLRCPWCSNPESQKFIPEVEFFPHKCIHCGLCLELCPKGAINADLSGGGFKIDRSRCDDCGQCAERCPTGALRKTGSVATVVEILREVEKDRSYFRKSGGGITLSGGEPLAQPQFALEILKGCFEKNIHTAIETAGYIAWTDFEPVLPFTDLIIYDIKHWDERIHERVTGISNSRIIQNLTRLSKTDKEIVARVPLIPGFNADPKTLAEIARLIRDNGLKIVSLLPFHQLGKVKYRRLSREYCYGHFPNLLSVQESQTVTAAKRIFSGCGLVVQE